MESVRPNPSNGLPTLRNIYMAEAEEGQSDSDAHSITGNRQDTSNQNEQCLIDNPLLYLRPDEVDNEARIFASNHGLENQEELLIKAGRVLRDPEAWENVEGLTHEEKEALRRESTTGFWRQPKQLRVTIITLCVAAVVQGWNQTASNGANLTWPQQFGLVVEGCDPRGKDAWIFAIVNAAPYLAGSLIGCWLSDPLNEYFYGRRAAIAVSAFLILASAIGGAVSNSWRQLLACRVLLGIGMGCKASVVPVFSAEVSPSSIRGSLVMNWQVYDALGIFLGFTANLILSRTDKPAWRYQTASSVLPTIVLLTLIYVCPESPRFLIKRGRYSEAYWTLRQLRGEPLLAAKELFYTLSQMEAETRLLSRHINDTESSKSSSSPRALKGIHYWQKLGQLFTQPRIRRAALAAVVVMIGQQLCGVNVLAFYSSSFFCQASQTTSSPTQDKDLTPLWLSWGIGLVNFIFAFPAYYFIDTRGRRWLLLITLPFLAISMLATSLAFKIPAGAHSHAPVIALFTYIFMFFYSWGMGPVPFTLSAEVFPLENRVVGMSFAVFCNLFGAGLLTLFVPALTNAMGHAGLLGLFAGLNVVTFVLVFFCVRETAGAALARSPGSMTFMSLEELNYIFQVSGSRHAKYQWETVLPWAWKRYVRRDRTVGEQPEKLYTWAQAKETFVEQEKVLEEAKHA